MPSRRFPSGLLRYLRDIRCPVPPGRWRIVTLALVLALAAVPAPPTRSVDALDSTFVILRTEDAPLANSNSLTCDSTLAPVGECTLRAAVQASNNSGAGVHTIQLSKVGTYRLTVTGSNEDNAATGDLDIKQNILVENTSGGTVTVDGAGADRVFEIRPAGRLALVNVNIMGGLASNGVTANGDGGGIRADKGELSIVGGVIEANRADNAGGGIEALDTNVVISGAKIRNNAAAYGGGAYISNAKSSVTNKALIDASTIDGNRAVYFGGGMFVHGPLTVLQSLISNNTSDDPAGLFGNGGGLGHINGVAILRDTTVSTNHAQTGPSPSGQAGLGGGIHAQGDSLVLLVSSTVALNTARKSGGGIYETDEPGAVVRLANTIVAANMGPGLFANCRLPVVSNGYNLEANLDGVYTCLGSPQASDKLALNARLGPLADPDGNIPFHALLAGSPAIDGGNPAAVSDADLTAPVCPTRDQRNLPRPKDGDGNGQARCDIGAIELFAPYSANVGLTATNNANGVAQGSVATYTIKATNGGPDLAGGSRVTATFPTTLSNVSWTCAATGGSVCGTASGTGNIDAIVDLAVDGVVTFTATGTVATSASGSLAVTASVAVPTGLVDPVPADNGASDTDPIGPAEPTPTPTLSPSPTPTVTPTPTSTLCSARPNVDVTARSLGGGRLEATVRAPTLSGAANGLEQIVFTTLRNATVEIGGATVSPGSTIPLGGLTTITFIVTRQTAGQPAQVSFTVRDRCGDWPTFVGGGPSAF